MILYKRKNVKGSQKNMKVSRYNVQIFKQKRDTIKLFGKLW